MAGLPPLSRALALEARVQLRARLARLEGRGVNPFFMGARGEEALKQTSAELEQAAELGGPGRARCLHASAVSRLLSRDPDGALSNARRAIAAADDCRAASEHASARDESVLDRPWREDAVRGAQLDSRALAVLLLVQKDESSAEADTLLKQMRSLDEPGDRASVTVAFVHFMRRERDQGLEEIRSGWRTCRARTDARAAAAQRRFLRSLFVSSSTLQCSSEARRAPSCGARPTGSSPRRSTAEVFALTGSHELTLSVTARERARVFRDEARRPGHGARS